MSIKQILIDKLLSVYSLPVNTIIRRMNPAHKIAFQTKLFKHIIDDDHYVSLSFVPIHISEMNIGRQSNRNFSDTTIVLQGPVAEKNGFTLETVELYKKYYNNIHIVVSTWNSTKKETVQSLEKAGADVLLNKYPEVNGVGNINYQLVTSRNGIDYAKSIGAKYVWKTRTDQRYYNPCSLPCLHYLLTDKKLVMLGGVYNSFVKRVFHVSDFMSFGMIDEMVALYGMKLDTEDTTKTKFTHKNAKNDKSGFNQYMSDVKLSENGLLDIGIKYEKMAIECGNPETLIMYNYYKLITGDDSLIDLNNKYLTFLKKDIGIVDADVLGFFWIKYEFDSIKQNYYDRIGKLDFARWSSLQDVNNTL